MSVVEGASDRMFEASVARHTQNHLWDCHTRSASQAGQDLNAVNPQASSDVEPH